MGLEQERHQSWEDGPVASSPPEQQWVELGPNDVLVPIVMTIVVGLLTIVLGSWCIFRVALNGRRRSTDSLVRLNAEGKAAPFPPLQYGPRHGSTAALVETREFSGSDGQPKLTTRPPDLTELNVSVWEFHKPLHGVKKVEIIFFHGAQLGDDKDAFWKTWLSRDETVVWPKAWLAEKFPEARILSICYDSSVRKRDGQKDAYQTIENLMHDIIWNKACQAGQNCPVILVGHGFGGLIIKQFLLKCYAFSNWDPEKRDVQEMKMFLQNCKAVFYYSTPFGGTRLMDGVAYTDYILGNINQPLADFLKILSPETSRINYEFCRLRDRFKWTTQAIGEKLETKLTDFTKMVLVVPEASLRQDLDHPIYWADADHFNVSKAKNSSTCNIFTLLHDLVDDHYDLASLNTPTAYKSALHFSNDVHYVPLETTIGEIDDAFKESQVVVLYGDSGTGKSSLARYFALRFEEKHAQKVPSSTSKLSEPVVVFVSCGEGAKITSTQAALYFKFTREYPQNFKELDEANLKDSLQSELKNLLRDREALVVLDDVWQTELVKKVLVRGSKLKYLITTRNGGLWRHNAAVIKIDEMDMEHARLVLAKYAECEDPELSKGQADELIKKVGFHPLALATLGTVLRNEERKSPHMWQNLMDNFLDYLTTDDSSYHPFIFDEDYPRSLYAAMMLMVDTLDDDSKRILNAINNFEGQKIPESLVELFLSSAHPDVFKSFRIKIKLLERLSLIRRETEPFPFNLKLFNGGDGIESADGYDAFVIHDLRRKFLSYNDISTKEMVSFLPVDGESFHRDPDGRSKYALATLLCAVYGQGYVKETATNHLKKAYLFLRGHRIYMIWALVKLGCSVKDQGSTSTAAIEVFWTVFVHQKIDLHNMPDLLMKPTLNRCAIELVCWFLEFLRFYSFDLRLVDTGGSFGSLEVSTLTNNPFRSVFINLGSSLGRLTQLLSSYGGIESVAVLSIFRSLTGYATQIHPRRVLLSDIMSRMVATNLLDMLFVILGEMDRPHEFSCRLSIDILRGFLQAEPRGLPGPDLVVAVSKITCSSNLDIITKLVIQGPQRSANLREETTSLLGSIADCSKGAPPDVAKVLVKNLMEGESSFQATSLFEAVLTRYFLPSLERVENMEEDKDEDKCEEDDERALAFVEFAAIHLPSLLVRAIMRLSEDMEKRGGNFATFVAELAQVPHVARLIVSHDLQGLQGCLDKLVERLDQTVKTKFQIQALRALHNLAGGDTYKCDPETQVKMLETEHLLERVITFLSERPDMIDKCRYAALLFEGLVFTENRLQRPIFSSLSILAPHVKTCLERLAMLLGEDVSEKIQTIGLQVLLSIARLVFNFTTSGNGNLIEVSAISNLLGRAVTLLVPKLKSPRSESVKMLSVVVEFGFDERLGLEAHMRRLATPAVLENLTNMFTVGSMSFFPDKCNFSLKTIQSLATEPSVGELIAQFRNNKGLLIERLLRLVECNAPIHGQPNREPLGREVLDTLVRLPVRDKIETQIQNLNIAPWLLTHLYWRWSWTNVMREDYDAALKDLNRALEFVYDDTMMTPAGKEYAMSFLLRERGIARRYLDDLDSALDDLDRSVEINGNEYESLKHRGFVKFKLGDEEGARKDAERAIEIWPHRVHERRRVHAQRVDAYDSSLGLRPVEFLGYRL